MQNVGECVGAHGLGRQGLQLLGRRHKRRLCIDIQVADSEGLRSAQVVCYIFEELVLRGQSFRLYKGNNGLLFFLRLCPIRAIPVVNIRES